MAHGIAITGAAAVRAKRFRAGGVETVATALLIGIAVYCAFFYAETEATMGPIQRIFYFHAPSAWTGFIAEFISLGASIAYLRTRAPKWDWLAVASAEVSLPFITVMLVTGPIWAKPVWGIWWTWDWRLTSTFVLWLLYICYLLLRALIDDPERRAVFSAVFNVFAAIDVPLVYFSIWFFRTQHPQPVIGGGGSLTTKMLDSVLVCWAALTGVMFILLRQRYRLEEARHDVERLRWEAARRNG